MFMDMIPLWEEGKSLAMIQAHIKSQNSATNPRKQSKGLAGQVFVIEKQTCFVLFCRWRLLGLIFPNSSAPQSIVFLLARFRQCIFYQFAQLFMYWVINKMAPSQVPNEDCSSMLVYATPEPLVKAFSQLLIVKHVTKDNQTPWMCVYTYYILREEG